MISVSNQKNCLSGRPPFSFSGKRVFLRRGFTLLEIMITLAIGTVVVGSCVPAFLNLKAERELRTSARTVADLLTRARLDALAAGVSSRVGVTQRQLSYDKEPFNLEKGVKLRIRRPGDSSWQVPSTRLLTIQSSGICEPWQFEFSLADGSFLRARIDPLTGAFDDEEFYIH